MRNTGVLVSLVAAAALVSSADPASSQRRDRSFEPRAQIIQSDPYAVYDTDGVTVVGRDPDPFIRLMIRRDPKPWEHDS